MKALITLGKSRLAEQAVAAVKLRQAISWRPAKASWLAAFRSGLKAFLIGRCDDQGGSFGQFVAHKHVNWFWVMTDHTPNGRTVSLVRDRARAW